MAPLRAASILALLGPVIAIPAFAEIYLTEAEAVKAIFAGVKMERSELTLTDAEAGAIEKASGQTVRGRTLKFWKSAAGEIIFVDQVLGKHEFITYAVGIKPGGTVAGIEILEYRESYGQGVKEAPWRSQFVGKTVGSPLKIGDDIKNISGATLSSAHVAGGVKRLLATYDACKSRL